MRSFEGAHRAISYCGGVLEFDSVTKSYGGNLVLDDLSFAVQPGQMFGFCGANGAGKTTTMRIALGLVRADRGEVRWNGRTVDLEIRRRIGYMPEERGLYPKMRALDQLSYFGMLHGMSKPAARQAAAEWIDRLGVEQRTVMRWRSCRWATSNGSNWPPPSCTSPSCSSSMNRSAAWIR